MQGVAMVSDGLTGLHLWLAPVVGEERATARPGAPPAVVRVGRAARGRTPRGVCVAEETRQALVESGIPGFVAGQIVTVFEFLRRGAQDRTTNTVRALTGREPRGFARFAHDQARLLAG